ncbi:cytochrome P450 CYP749A22-like [Tripterygium wilfordii]|uniref:cytochrome P450 CYP749A22-like n=1 Tax=Tripterygium wilfordii TaxID=458696 RepID=UPI0018F83458|nr:cytochrome P450 CYP749A22-like [Tripterygium wilfordii]
MPSLGTLVLTSLGLYLLFIFFKFVHKVWWRPVQVQNFMASQGIKGPPYKLLYGSMKDMMQIIKESMSKPSDLSHDMFVKAQPHYHTWFKKYGTNFLYFQGPKPTLFVSEAELAKDVLNNKEKAYPKAELESYVKKLIGNSLVTYEGEQWSKMRKLANHAFHGETLKNMVSDMVASTETMMAGWKSHEGREIEVYEEFKLLTSEVISRTAFGSSFVEGKDIFEKLRKVIVIAHTPPPKFRIPGTSLIFKNSGEMEAEKLVTEMKYSILGIIRKRESQAISSGEAEEYGNDYLGLLLRTFHDADESKRISLEDVIDECKGIYFAGQETTTNLLSWVVMLLAIHTDWQEEARKEVQKAFAGRNPTQEGIAKLKTITMIIHETLRLYPPAMGVIRKVGRKVRLGKLDLLPDMYCFVSIVKLHHDPQIWGEDVNLFKPERFAEGVAKATKNEAAAFFPFSIGPRICAGSNFAVTEAKIALSMILQRYSFTLSPAYVHSPLKVFVLRPQNGVQIILRPLVE